MPRPHTRTLTPVAHIPPRAHGIAEDADHGYDRARDRAQAFRLASSSPSRATAPTRHDPDAHPEALGSGRAGERAAGAAIRGPGC